MITPRDNEILNFINITGAATTSQISRAFMGDKSRGEIITRRRMKRLHDLKMIKRERSFINTEYVYFKKNTLLDHKLTLTEFHIRLRELQGEELRFNAEVQLGDVRPDAVCDYLYKGNVYQFFIEVHLATMPFNQQKYEDFYASAKYKQWYKIFPRVIIISDREIHLQESKIRYIQIPLCCENIKKILF
jgi:hypothetical protein